MKHTIDINTQKVNVIINIELGEPHNNGHADFSITGTLWEIGRARTDKNMTAAGVCHEEILKHFPKLKVFTDLHLHDWQGIPFGGFNTGYYFLKQYEPESVMRHLLCTTADLAIIETAEDYEHFCYLCQSIGLLYRFNEMAKDAIAKLEKMTGEEFEPRPHWRGHFDGLSAEQMNAVSTKYAEGYYLPQNIAKRRDAVLQDRRKVISAQIEKEYSKTIDAAKKRREIKMLLLGLPSGGNTNYYIPADNTEVVLNWIGCNDLMSKNEILAATAELEKIGVSVSLGRK